MIRKNYKSVLAALALVVALNGCDFYYKNMPFAPIPPQTISGPIEIGSEWVEIVPPAPLRPIAEHNWISLGFYGENKGDFTDDIQKGETLILADGGKTKIEGVLTDNVGENYELQISGRGGGIILTRKMTAETDGQATKYKFSNFPTDRVYIKLRLRSEIPLKCDKIEWIGSKPS